MVSIKKAKKAKIKPKAHKRKKQFISSVTSANTNCHLVYLGALKYYLNSQPSSTPAFCDALIKDWVSIPTLTKRELMAEVEQRFTDYQRIETDKEGLQKRGYNIQVLGSATNREAWENLRKIWKPI